MLSPYLALADRRRSGSVLCIALLIAQVEVSERNKKEPAEQQCCRRASCVSNQTDSKLQAQLPNLRTSVLALHPVYPS